MRIKYLIGLSLILATSLFADPGKENKGQLKKSMKVVPLSSTYLSTEYGGTNHASAVLADGVGIYTTQEDEYAKAISYLNGKYGDDALKDEKSLKDYVLDNGTVADKELAEKLETGVAKSVIGDPCDDGKSTTENDVYTDENFTCKGKKVYNSIKCNDEDDIVGTEFEFEGKSYLIVDDNTIRNHLDRADTLCTSKVTDMKELFSNNDTFNQNINHWDTSNVTDMSYMFGSNNYYSLSTIFNKPIGEWDTSNVTDMSYMFAGAELFNQSIGDWDTSNVTDMSYMFVNAKNFNQPIGNWDVSKVTNMGEMLSFAESFNQRVDFNSENLENVGMMFYNATAFNNGCAAGEYNCPLKMNTSKVGNFWKFFWLATSFNQSINYLDLSSLIYMQDAFLMYYEWGYPNYYDNVFNNGCADGDYSCPVIIDAPNLTSATSVFKGANKFNQEVIFRNVNNLTSIYSMFEMASAFNNGAPAGTSSKPFNLKNIPNLEDIGSLFDMAVSFNQPIEVNLENVENFDIGYAFYYASSFNQDLSHWCFKNINKDTYEYSTYGTFAKGASAWEASKRPKWGMNCE